MKIIKGDITIEDVSEDFVYRVLNLQKPKIDEEKQKFAMQGLKKPTIKKPKKTISKNGRVEWNQDNIDKVKIMVEKFGKDINIKKHLAKELNTSVASIGSAIWRWVEKNEPEPHTKKVDRTNKWTEEEKQLLIDIVAQKGKSIKTFREISKKIGRTQSACANQYFYLELHKRIPQEKVRNFERHRKPRHTEPKRWTQT